MIFTSREYAPFKSQRPAGTGLLDLVDTPEVLVLRERLAAVGPVADVVLTTEQEAVYQATATWLNQMWTLGSSLSRFEY
ncbi:hypothetical protein [Streptosporangium sp. NPDC002544]|uniref:hypothetical protein n=1 Tax=unclassified Streptosporangium TaxID=2632669 RepID=UPI00331E9BC7